MFRCVFTSIFDHSSTSTFVRSGIYVGCLHSNSAEFFKGVLWGGGQVSQVPPHQTRSSVSLWTLLYALVCSHFGRGCCALYLM